MLMPSNYSAIIWGGLSQLTASGGAGGGRETFTNSKFCTSASTWTKTIALIIIIYRVYMLAYRVPILLNAYGDTVKGAPFARLDDDSGITSITRDSFETSAFPRYLTRGELRSLIISNVVFSFIGLIMAFVLLAGAILKISRCLHVWLMYTFIFWMISWVSGGLSSGMSYLFIGAMTVWSFIIILASFVVWTLSCEIDEHRETEKERQRNLICPPFNGFPISLNVGARNCRGFSSMDKEAQQLSSYSPYYGRNVQPQNDEDLEQVLRQDWSIHPHETFPMNSVSNSNLITIKEFQPQFK